MLIIRFLYVIESISLKNLPYHFLSKHPRPFVVQMAGILEED